MPAPLQRDLENERTDATGHAPKFYAMVEHAQWTEVMQALRQNIALDDLRTRSGLTALGRAVLDGATLVVEHLLDHGASPCTFTLFKGETFSPLWAALVREDEAIVRVLLQAGADANETGQGFKPLIYAANHRLAMATRALCQAGSHPDPVDQGLSPLHLWIPKVVETDARDRAVFGSPDPILSLVDAGANPDALNAAGQNTSDAAREAWNYFLSGPAPSITAQVTLIALERSALRRSSEGLGGVSRPFRRL